MRIPLPSPLRSDDALPLHRRAERALRQMAARPEYAGGKLLPDEVTLANRLGVSRGTARAALARLAAEGLIERKAGVGTRVVQRAAESAIGAWRSFSREMERKGISVQLFDSNLREVPTPEDAAAALRVEPGTMVQRLDRVRGWDGTPVLRTRSWFHPDIRFSRGETFSRPLYEIVSDTSGIAADHASEAFAAVAAKASLAKALRVPKGSPLLLRRHAVFDAGGRALEFAEVHYVSARFTLTLDLRRE